MNIFLRFLFRASPILLFSIVGNSMEPTLRDGQRVVVIKFPKYTPHDIVVAKDPRDKRLIVKRITNMNKQKLYIEGDNKKESTDSRHFGWIPKELIVGKVVYPHS